MLEPAVIYTDGSCSGNPGVGGWAFFVASRGCWSSGKADTTNNEMELKAIYEAMNYCVRNGVKEATIHSDSAYCINGYNNWMHNWRNNFWRTSSNKRIKNKDLWVDVYLLSKEVNINFVKVKGHSGNPGNDFVDRKAVEAMNKVKNRLQKA